MTYNQNTEIGGSSSLALKSMFVDEELKMHLMAACESKGVKLNDEGVVNELLEEESKRRGVEQVYVS